MLGRRAVSIGMVSRRLIPIDPEMIACFVVKGSRNMGAMVRSVEWRMTIYLGNVLLLPSDERLTKSRAVVGSHDHRRFLSQTNANISINIPQCSSL